MRTQRQCFAFSAVAVAALTSFVLPATADVIQSVWVEHKADGSVVDEDSDGVRRPTSSDVTRDVVAEIGLPLAYQAVAAAGQFGSVGVSASLVESGIVSTLETSVFISSDEFVNLTGVPQRATANFVIDGGSMLMIAARNASITYDLRLVGERPDSFAVFSALGVLEADSAGDLSFVASGENIGSTFDPLTGRVEIPLSFQSLDLGIIGPNERLLLSYKFSFLLASGSVREGLGFHEGMGARFSDPFNLSSNPVLGTIQLEPAAPVPEPSSAALLIPGGVLLLLGIFWRHKRSDSGRQSEGLA